MAKINTAIKDFKEKLKEYTGPIIFERITNLDEKKIIAFIDLFNKVTDKRIQGMTKYSCKNIVVITFFAILDERETWQEIVDFASDRSTFLSIFLDMSEGIPSHDTFRRVFSLINTDTLLDVIVNFLNTVTKAILSEFTDENKRELLSIDGQAANGSGRKYNTNEEQRNVQLMHFYLSSTGVCIGSVAIDKKTNEIPVAQEILSGLNLKNKIVTADAMNCQKPNAKIVIQGKGDYVFALKQNHKEFFGDIEKEFKDIIENKKYKDEDYYKMESEKNHNQVEVREFYRIDADKFVQDKEWENLCSIVCYKKSIYNVITKEEHIEYRYYISSLRDVQLIAEAIRGHWAIENNLHHELDTVFRQDAKTTTDPNAVNNFSILSKACLTLLELMTPLFGNISKKRLKKRFRCNFEMNCIKLFSLLDGVDINNFIKNNIDNAKKQV